jgi:hypothetical protein
MHWQSCRKLLIIGAMLTDSFPSWVLALILALQVKHFICDGPLQTLQMVKDKSIYGKPMGLAHAGIHLVGTALVATLFGLPLFTVAKLAVAEGLIHYHIDYFKERLVKGMDWRTPDASYWWALTGDQALHHASYVLLAAWAAFTL